MGRWSYSGRQEADFLSKVSVYFLNKHGYFNQGWKSGTITWSRNGEMTGRISIQSSLDESEQNIRFIYTQTDRSTGEKKDFDYKIPLATTPCNFGGKRYWFVCPWYANGIFCGRRVGALFMGGKYLACRHCYNLTYNSRNLFGASKIAGQVISEPELEGLWKEAKTQYYAGKMTRKYRRYLRKSKKADRQLMFMASSLGLYK